MEGAQGTSVALISEGEGFLVPSSRLRDRSERGIGPIDDRVRTGLTNDNCSNNKGIATSTGEGVSRDRRDRQS
jgi:hypothetical protein